jgi:hypothetical protein
MVIKNRRPRRGLMIELLGGFGGEQEIFIQEFFHYYNMIYKYWLMVKAILALQFIGIYPPLRA